MATPNFLTNRIPLYSVSELTPRLITTTGPKLLRVTFAFTSFGFRTTGPRVPSTSAAVSAASAAGAIDLAAVLLR